VSRGCTRLRRRRPRRIGWPISPREMASLKCCSGVQLALAGFFEELGSLHVLAILGQAETNRTHHLFRAAWLGQITEDLAIVYRGDGAIEIFVSREQHPYRLR